MTKVKLKTFVYTLNSDGYHNINTQNAHITIDGAVTNIKIHPYDIRITTSDFTKFLTAKYEPTIPAFELKTIANVSLNKTTWFSKKNPASKNIDTHTRFMSPYENIFIIGLDKANRYFQFNDKKALLGKLNPTEKNR